MPSPQRELAAPDAARWYPSQLVELRERIDAAPNWLVLTVAERVAYCRLGVLVDYVRQGHLTVKRGEECAEALMRGEEPALTRDEARKMYDAPMPGMTVDVGKGPKPVTARGLNDLLGTQAARQARTAATTALTAARVAPRAREHAPRRNGARRTRVTARGDPDEPSDEDELGRLDAASARLDAHLQRRQARRFFHFRESAAA